VKYSFFKSHDLLSAIYTTIVEIRTAKGERTGKKEPLVGSIQGIHITVVERNIHV
jgi:hypothetical protein